jgi:hypothetical protein
MRRGRSEESRRREGSHSVYFSTQDRVIIYRQKSRTSMSGHPRNIESKCKQANTPSSEGNKGKGRRVEAVRGVGKRERC